ncbi:MAG: peptidyl-prolyl cis-trans isomerase [Candidatus Omnitrophota bacterium]
MIIKRIVMAMFCTAAVCICLAPACNAQDKVVAVVNNEIITQKDLDGFISFMRVQLAREYSDIQLEKKINAMKPDLLQRLIEDRLILQEARKNNISIDKNRIKAKILELKRAHNTEKEFQDFLAVQGVTEADLEQKMKDQMMTYEIVENKIKNKIVIKPSEITDYYEKNIDQFVVTEQREFVSIVTEDKDIAGKVCAGLKSGEIVAAIEIAYSIKANTFTAKKGGELKKEIEDVVFAMNVNDVSEPVKIDNVYYVFQLVRITPEHRQQLIDAQNDINRLLFDKKMQEEMIDWLDQLKKKAYIDLK